MIEICKIYTIKVITNGQRQFESWSTALSLLWGEGDRGGKIGGDCDVEKLYA